MEELTSWATAVCTVAVICTLFEMLAPSGNISKMLNFVLGLFLVVAVLVPFANMIESNSLNFKSIEFKEEEFTLSEKVSDLTIASGKSAIEKLVAQCMEEKEIPYKKIVVNMDSSDGYSIDIIRVEIYVSAEYRNSLAEIQNAVKEKTGITPDVYVG